MIFDAVEDSRPNIEYARTRHVVTVIEKEKRMGRSLKMVAEMDELAERMSGNIMMTLAFY